jgi:hypothetical protein
MKTLRETLDQLDEISRRGLLKGAGAATALGGAGMAGYQLGKRSTDTEYPKIPESPEFYYLIGFLVQLTLHQNTKALARFQEPVRKLYKAVRIDMETMDAQKGHKLSMAFSKGAAEGSKKNENFQWMHKQSGGEGHYTRNEELGEYIATELEPYYNKMQTILKQPTQGQLEETSPEAIAKIDKLSR